MPIVRASKWLALAFATLVLLGGCVYSLYPFYGPGQSTDEPALAGKWAVNCGDSDGDPAPDRIVVPTDESAANHDRCLLTIRPSRDGGYQATSEDLDARETEHYSVHLVRAGGSLFADVAFEDREEKRRTVEVAAVPEHMLFKVLIHGNTLKAAELSKDWLDDQIQSGKLKLAHQEADDLLLTGSTVELTNLLAQIANEPAAFPEAFIAHRVT